MALYSYKVKTKKGDLIEDVIQSTSRKEAAQALKADGYQILTVRRVDSSLGSLIGGKISVSEKAAFCRFVATMLRAGLTLPEAIDIIKEETKNNHQNANHQFAENAVARNAGQNSHQKDKGKTSNTYYFDRQIVFRTRFSS